MKLRSKSVSKMCPQIPNFIFLCSVLSALALAGCDNNSKPHQAASTEPAQVAQNGHMSQSQNLRAAPPFELTDAQGKKVKLEDFKGTPFILHFWATWCAPCLEEIPAWLEFAKANKDRKIKLVAVSLDQSWAEAQKVLSADKLLPNIVSLLDTEAKVPDAYGSYQFPETYLISADSKIVTKWVGAQDWNSPKIRKIIDSWIP